MTCLAFPRLLTLYHLQAFALPVNFLRNETRARFMIQGGGLPAIPDFLCHHLGSWESR